MSQPLAEDRKGNALTAFLPAARTPTPPSDAAMPAALAAIWHGTRLLLVFDRHRRQWELPGGKIDPGETPLEAAIRELHEETGLRLPTLTLAGYARFRLTTPPRSEYAALYTAHTTTRHEDFTPTTEISAIHWWNTTGPRLPNTQTLDITLAQQTHPNNKSEQRSQAATPTGETKPESEQQDRGQIRADRPSGDAD